MNKYDWNKIIEVVLYILNKTGGIDYYHVFKILYFAEKEHLQKWGNSITSDENVALPYGPKLSNLNSNQTIIDDISNHINTSDLFYFNK